MSLWPVSSYVRLLSFWFKCLVLSALQWWLQCLASLRLFGTMPQTSSSSSAWTTRRSSRMCSRSNWDPLLVLWCIRSSQTGAHPKMGFHHRGGMLMPARRSGTSWCLWQRLRRLRQVNDLEGMSHHIHLQEMIPSMMRAQMRSLRRSRMKKVRQIDLWAHKEDRSHQDSQA